MVPEVIQEGDEGGRGGGLTSYGGRPPLSSRGGPRLWVDKDDAVVAEYQTAGEDTGPEDPRTASGTSTHCTVHNGVAGTARHTQPWGRVCTDNTTTTDDQNQAFSTTQAPCDHSCPMRDGLAGRGVCRGPVLLSYDSASRPQVVGLSGFPHGDATYTHACTHISPQKR